MPNCRSDWRGEGVYCGQARRCPAVLGTPWAGTPLTVRLGDLAMAYVCTVPHPSNSATPLPYPSECTHKYAHATQRTSGEVR